MNVKVRHDVAEQQIVDMTRFENAFNRPSYVLNVRPVVGEFVWRKIGEGCDVSPPKHNCHMAGRYGVPFQKSLADSAAVEGPIGQVGAKGASDTLLARFPVLRPGSFHVFTSALFGACSICPTRIGVDRSSRFEMMRVTVRPVLSPLIILAWRLLRAIQQLPSVQRMQASSVRPGYLII